MRRGPQVARGEWRLPMSTHDFSKLYQRALADLPLTPWWKVGRAAAIA